jgi:disulfide bond formation protein DsbB
MSDNHNERRRAILNYIFLSLSVVVFNCVLIAAMVMQYGYSEIPCPLCLLQRYAFFGIIFAMLLSLKYGESTQRIGVTLLMSWLLILISGRQSALDIVSRPGHQWVGSALLNIHMPVWSFIIGFLFIFFYCVKLILLGKADEEAVLTDRQRRFAKKIKRQLFIITLLLLMINFLSVLLQCGVGHICHTSSYRFINSTMD